MTPADQHALREALAFARFEETHERRRADNWRTRALAAEAENTRLKETVEAAATRFEDIAAGRAFQPRLHAATGATGARSVLATIPPKENP